LAVFGAAIRTGVAAGQVTELRGRFVDHLDAAADTSSVDLPGDVCSAGLVDHSPQALTLVVRERRSPVLAQLSHGATMRRAAAIMGKVSPIRGIVGARTRWNGSRSLLPFGMKHLPANAATSPQLSRTSRLEETFRAFLDLSYEHQLEIGQRVAEYLSLTVTAAAPVDDELAQRHETIVCIRRAQAHLKLERPPTVKEYTTAAAELDLPWSWQRIQRRWGTWLAATKALNEGRVPASVVARSYRARHCGRKRTHEEHWIALRRWLATDPANERIADYDDFARAYNNAIPAGERALPRAGTIMVALALPWRQLIAVARGETSEELAGTRRVERSDWSRGPDRLIGLGTIARMCGASREATAPITRRLDFPAPVARFGRGRAWLFEEVEAYLAGQGVPRFAPNRLRHLYLDVHQYADAVAVSVATAQRPGPDVARAGMVGGTCYWLKSEVDEWLSRSAHKVAARQARRERAGAQPIGGGSDFVTSGDLEKRFGISHHATMKLVRQDGFPDAVISVGHNRVWSLRQVEAFLAAQPLPPVPDRALTAKLLDAGALSDTLALRRGTTYPSRTKLPPSLFTAGRRQLWHADEIDAWIAALPERARARINRRRGRRGLAPL
jgi:predicted DNA-binding transcriptional regulator AlpA